MTPYPSHREQLLEMRSVLPRDSNHVRHYAACNLARIGFARCGANLHMIGTVLDDNYDRRLAILNVEPAPDIGIKHFRKFYRLMRRVRALCEMDPSVRRVGDASMKKTNMKAKSKVERAKIFGEPIPEEKAHAASVRMTTRRGSNASTSCTSPCADKRPSKGVVSQPLSSSSTEMTRPRGPSLPPAYPLSSSANSTTSLRTDTRDSAQSSASSATLSLLDRIDTSQLSPEEQKELEEFKNLLGYTSLSVEYAFPSEEEMLQPPPRIPRPREPGDPWPEHRPGGRIRLRKPWFPLPSRSISRVALHMAAEEALFSEALAIILAKLDKTVSRAVGSFLFRIAAAALFGAVVGILGIPMTPLPI